MRLFLILLATAILCLGLAALSWAARQTYTATYRYAMGDDETRSRARQKCLAGAKRRVLEQAGSYVSSQSTVENYALTKDEVMEIAAGVMEVDVVEEHTELSNDALVVVMEIKARMDPDEVRTLLDEAVRKAEQEKAAQDRTAADQEARISELEKQLEALRQQQEAQAATTADSGDDARDDGSSSSDTALRLAAMLPEIAVRILTGMPAERRGAVLRDMAPADRARIQDHVQDLVRPQVPAAVRPERPDVRTRKDDRRLDRVPAERRTPDNRRTAPQKRPDEPRNPWLPLDPGPRP